MDFYDYPKKKVDAIVFYDMAITIEHLAKDLGLAPKEVMQIYDYVVDHKLLKRYGKDNGGYKLETDYLEELLKIREMGE